MFENGQLTVLNMQSILPNRFQPRIKFDEERLEELAESINKYGVIQPIVVRPVGNKFEIIAGERRYKASRLANKSTIPAIIVNLSDKDSEEIALLENIQRQQLNPIEEAVSYKRILDMGYISQEELAKKIGKPQTVIVNKIRLLNLDDEVQNYLLNNKISERHARSLLRISNKEKQVMMLHRITEERLTVKQTDREIAKLLENMESKVAEAVEINLPKNDVSNTKEEIENLFDDNEELKINERGSEKMDIDKIMREAKDINVPQAAPKDISGLMQTNGVIQNVPTVNVGAQENLEPGKFVNVAPQQPVINTQAPQNSGGVTFDSMFNQPVDISTSSNNVLQPQNNLNDISQNQVVSNEPVNISDETKKEISSAVSDALKRFNEKKVNKVVDPSLGNTISSVPEVTSNPISEIEQSSVSQNVNQQPISDIPMNENNNLNTSIPSVDIIDNNVLNSSDSTIASPIAQDVKSVNTPLPFAQIVKMLRECADKIEASGYFVNVDELDVGNQYKVTFTIDKE